LKTGKSGRVRWLFYAAFLLSMLFSALYLAYRRGEGLMDFFYQQGINLLDDFTNNLHYPTHEGGPYFDAIWATFPPLAYTLYYLVNVCFTRAIANAETVAYIVITTATAVLMLYAVSRIFERYGRRKGGSAEALLFTLCILFSGVGIYTLERGNSVFNVVVILLFALYLRDEEQPWKREAALWLIAVAAGLKIYPCLFGLLYLLEKRYREAIRLVIYGLVLFFVPFLWFGGLDGFKQFLYNQQQIQLLQRNDFLTSISSVERFLAAELGWSAQPAGWIAQVLALLFGVAALVCVALIKELWQRCLLLVGIATLVPGWSDEYMALCFAIPAVLFVCRDFKQLRKLDGFYAALLGGIFVLLPFGTGFSLHATTSWNMLVCFACVYLIEIVAIADSIRTFVRGRRAAAVR
jgi:hypothetical protein